MSDAPETIEFADFAKIKMKVAKIIEAVPHPNADKLLLLKIDLGHETRQICAGIKGHYAPEQLVGKLIVVVANLAPRMMRGQQSQGMLLAASAPDKSRVILLTPDQDIAPGSDIS